MSVVMTIKEGFVLFTLSSGLGRGGGGVGEVHVLA
jgi:hypothetical protein